MLVYAGLWRVPEEVPMIHVRPVRLPEDHAALVQLDSSFTTDRVYRVAATPTSFTLVEEAVAPPLRKDYPLDDELGEDRLWEHGVVAELAGAVVGFGALRMEHWNRRAAVWHLYVERGRRADGVGALLLRELEAYARQQRAWCLWLETSTANVPAIQFYRRMGFRWCGLDQSLYAPESAGAGETALYFVRELRDDGGLGAVSG